MHPFLSKVDFNSNKIDHRSWDTRQRLKLSPPSQMFIIIIFIPITQQPEQDRWAENQPTAGLSSLNEYEYENEYENGMRRSRTELSKVLQSKEQFLIANELHRIIP